MEVISELACPKGRADPAVLVWHVACAWAMCVGRLSATAAAVGHGQSQWAGLLGGVAAGRNMPPLPVDLVAITGATQVSSGEAHDRQLASPAFVDHGKFLGQKVVIAAGRATWR